MVLRRRTAFSRAPLFTAALLSASCHSALPRDPGSASSSSSPAFVRVEVERTSPPSTGIEVKTTGTPSWTRSEPLVLRVSDACDVVSRAPADCTALATELAAILDKAGVSVITYDAYIEMRRRAELTSGASASSEGGASPEREPVGGRSRNAREARRPPPAPLPPSADVSTSAGSPEPKVALVVEALQNGLGELRETTVDIRAFTSDALGKRGDRLEGPEVAPLAAFAAHHDRRPAQRPCTM
jgi:hypothetical protein